MKVQVTKTFKTIPDKVFEAWINPEKIGKWMFGPDVRDEQIVSLENHPEKGGTFSYVVRRDGEEINHTGEYLDLKKPARVIFTWGIEGESEGESEVRVEINPIPGGCTLTLTHTLDPKWEEYAERTRNGWSTMLDKLDEFLSTKGTDDGGN